MVLVTSKVLGNTIVCIDNGTNTKNNNIDDN
jgi:hypothetical protein